MSNLLSRFKMMVLIFIFRSFMSACGSAEDVASSCEQDVIVSSIDSQDGIIVASYVAKKLSQECVDLMEYFEDILVDIDSPQHSLDTSISVNGKKEDEPIIKGSLQFQSLSVSSGYTSRGKVEERIRVNFTSLDN